MPAIFPSWVDVAVAAARPGLPILPPPGGICRRAAGVRVTSISAAQIEDPMFRQRLMPCRGPGTVDRCLGGHHCAGCALSSKPNKPGTACCHGANAAAAADAYRDNPPSPAASATHICSWVASAAAIMARSAKHIRQHQLHRFATAISRHHHRIHHGRPRRLKRADHRLTTTDRSPSTPPPAYYTTPAPPPAIAAAAAHCHT